MFGYYLDLALRSLGRNKALTALMVLAIALGIGASMTTLTVLHVLSGDPLPGQSARLYYPQIDPRTRDGYRPGAAPETQLTWIDGMNLLHAHRAQHQALMTGGAVALQPEQPGMDPFYADARYTTADFFPMFQVPLRYGRVWQQAEDDAKARVVVISRKLNDKLFAGRDSTGQILRVQDSSLRIIGVLDSWRPTPHFYDLNMSGYSDSEDVFIPLSTSRELRLDRQGSINCWGGYTEDHMETAPCTWLQFWVQLDSPAQVTSYKEFLIHYSQEQRRLGRFERAPNVRLPNLMGWLDINHVVPSDARLQTWLALGFLLVCLVNTVGLMLAKFLRRAGELGVRRALGASRWAIFMQLLMEAGLVGLLGGIGGLLLAMLGLWAIRHRPSDYAALAQLDWSMLGLTFALAIGATLLAGVLPAWRACRTVPALHLKSQ